MEAWGWVQKVKVWWRGVEPGPWAWRGAALGLLAVALGWGSVICYNIFSAWGYLSFGVGMGLLLIAGVAAAGVVLLLLRFFRSIPLLYRWILICCLPLLFQTFMPGNFGAILLVLAVAASASLVGAALGTLLHGGWRTMNDPRRGILIVFGTLGALVMVVWGYGLGVDGWNLPLPVNAAALAGEHVVPLRAADPSQPGVYAVRTLFYGAGQDLHRPEYQQVDLKSGTVDGSLLVSGWSDLRRGYWGFGPEALPINARVWYPDGAGPFPLVVIVHGDHPMEDFSDPGYDYLGELLASRGFIVASVDENFFNTSLSADLMLLNGLVEENDARGWLLLEHLRFWRMWNELPGNPFYGKVDLQKIALIGHSRGGEAVMVAATFNRLPYYPDNAALAFDYNFNIRAVVGLAPVDGQYQPAGRALPLENFDYLVLQGVHDMDVSLFRGARLYERLQFNDEQFHFKGAVYFWGANHGQFNTTWGRKDGFEPPMRLMNLQTLMAPEDQQQVAKVYISAFLESSLRGAAEYGALFRDYRTAAGWLPDTIYLSQYEDSTTRWVARYEESDIDLTTVTLAGAAARGEHLQSWRELLVPSKYGRDANTSAVYLGWDEKATASYAITLPTAGVTVTAEDLLVFSLADAGEAATDQPIDLTIEVVDRKGAAARLPLSHDALLQPQLPGWIYKLDLLYRFEPASEVVFRSFELPLADFVRVNPAFDPEQLAIVRWMFDRSPAGTVALDDVGLRGR